MSRELRTRILSGIVMIAVALGALLYGDIAFWALVAVLSVTMMHEWAMMAGVPKWKWALAVGVALMLQAYSLYFDASVPVRDPGSLATEAVMIAGLSAILLAVVTFTARLGWGLLYATLPALALLYLREQPAGLALALFTMVIVWATDIGAYFAGRTIGGPKLAPKLSPNKTWAGLIGGAVAAEIVGSLVAWQMGLPMILASACAPLAVLAQMGDLFESWLKRISGVKDSGRILPGHGGVLDRLDGLVPVAVIMAALVAAGVLHGA
ncbi:phosphatidate cytidylyltransferase [Sphingomonas crocodyli]|uniref:Phosphatidate cytidylyltransferase n=1 Tax=Sphingomonas crocodyli TaxID=1979270 RepID=A0A437M863_9SPHN|nr:phosphatidate cytidylyltransferase [Sphingomonas crocodyli]RVT93803.1 phosphatidate cytidylyltransferase [Sphingomonas crocodyli]